MADLHDWNSDEFLGFNLKLLGKKTKKNVLVSAGKLSDKERMFPALQKLAKLNVELFATPGTFRFLSRRGSTTRRSARSPTAGSRTSARSWTRNGSTSSSTC